MKLKSAGNVWLQETLELKRFSIPHHSYIDSNDKIEVAPNEKIN